MKPSEWLAISLAVAAIITIAATKAPYCYVCMDRDMNNCNRGNTTCDGFCYKVVDTTHNVIVKGCAEHVQVSGDNPTNFDNPDWAPEPPIELYWIRDNGTAKHVRGHAYFCKNETGMCNSSPPSLLIPLNPYYSFAFTLFLVLSLHQFYISWIYVWIVGIYVVFCSVDIIDFFIDWFVVVFLHVGISVLFCIKYNMQCTTYCRFAS